jgi:phage tail sheath protein FI
MRIFETPGVYYERADANQGGISALRTDVAGFAGIAERGPLHLAVPVESYRQFVAWFGDVTDQGYLAYCARAFFENGGRRMWAVRVASEAAACAMLRVDDRIDPDLVGPPPLRVPMWRIEASSPGTWGNQLAVRISEVRRIQVRVPRIDPEDPTGLVMDSITGFAPHALVELVQEGAPRLLAVVLEVDAQARRLRLDRPAVGFTPGAPLRAETITYTIDLFTSGRLVAQFADLSLVPEHPRYGPALLRQPWQTIDPRAPEGEPAGASSNIAIEYFRTGRERRPEAPPWIVVRELRDAAARAHLRLLAPTAVTAPPQPLLGGADGLAALAVRDFIGEASTPFDSDAALAAARRGIVALEAVDEVSLLAVPDIHIQPRPPTRHAEPPVCEPDRCLPLPPQPASAPPRIPGDAPPLFSLDEIYRVQAAMVDQCEKRRDRIALLDAPFRACARLAFAASELRAWRQRFDSAFAALYAPWLGVVDPLRLGARRPPSPELTRLVPPSGHVAGMTAANDLRRGVHVAPANVPLDWVQKVSLELDAERHGILNRLGVNVIRAEAGRGLRVMGARTAASDPDWRFLNVRRLVSMIRKAIEVAIQWAVFEPNDWRTRAKLALVIGSFLEELRARGALAGATADAAYFVRCDDANNPPDARARGELLVEVGIAPGLPYEFVVLRIGRDANGFAIAESAAMMTAA